MGKSRLFVSIARTMHYGIAFPFTRKSVENTFTDLNRTASDGVRSQIMHLIFTPRGQRLRRPEFGSRLIEFVFNPNDGESWSDVVGEIRSMISANVPGCSLNNIEIYETDNGRGLVARILYTVSGADGTTENEIITRL